MDSIGSIAIFSEEQAAPYKRPPLSKDLWNGKPLERIWLETHRYDSVTRYQGMKIIDLDPENYEVTDAADQKYRYDMCLLATGGKPRELLTEAKGIIYFRTLEDYHHLSHLMQTKANFLVIGGGFIGSEMAAALAIQHKTVHLLFPEKAMGTRQFPESISNYVNQYYEDKGVLLYPEDTIEQLTQTETGYHIRTKQNKQWKVDGIVAGLGINPETTLAEAAGIEVDNGILVDEQLQTSQTDVFAAGDVIRFYNPGLDDRIRVEHENHANKSGRFAGYNMAGKQTPYTYLPFFYGDLFDLGYEAIGRVDSSMLMVEDWKDKPKKGVVYYLHEQQVKGVLLWNVWEKVDAARDLIEKKTIWDDPQDLCGAL